MRRAKGVEVNEAEGKILQQMTRETKSRAGLVTRSHIILETSPKRGLEFARV